MEIKNINQPWEMDTCQITGLPITRKQEWTNVTFGTDYYRLTFSIIGENIILSKTWGYSKITTNEKYISLLGDIVNEFISIGQQFILIEEYTHFTGVSTKAKKFYINYQNNNKRLKVIVFCNISIYIKILLKMGKYLGLVRFQVEIVNDYKAAVLFAQQSLIKPELESDWKDNLQGLNVAALQPFVHKTKCPYTGLHIITKPEWTNIDIDKIHMVTFRLIGDRILQTIPIGNIDKTWIQRLAEERDKFLGKTRLFNKKYVEIKDYSKMTGGTSIEERQKIIDLLFKDMNQKNRLGYIAYNTYKRTKWMFNVGSKLQKKICPVKIVDNYKAAIEEAINILHQNGIVTRTKTYQEFTKNDWKFRQDSFSTRFEVFENNIIYAEMYRFWREQHANAFFIFYEKILSDNGLLGEKVYFIVNWEDLNESSLRARMLFLNVLKKLNEKAFCILGVVFGLNKFINILHNINKSLIPFPIVEANNLAEAMTIIERKKNETVETCKGVKEEKKGISF